MFYSDYMYLNLPKTAKTTTTNNNNNDDVPQKAKSADCYDCCMIC